MQLNCLEIKSEYAILVYSVGQGSVSLGLIYHSSSSVYLPTRPSHFISADIWRGRWLWEEVFHPHTISCCDRCFILDMKIQLWHRTQFNFISKIEFYIFIFSKMIRYKLYLHSCISLQLHCINGYFGKQWWPRWNASYRPPDKSVYLKIIFLIYQPKHMLWVLKRTV